MLKTYLRAYNLVLAIGWAVFLIYQIMHGFKIDTFSLWLLNICQVAALLEVLHAVLKWVRTPVFTTLIQVASRVFVLFWINRVPAEAQIEVAGLNGIMMVSVAWGITEVVRYSFYLLGLMGKEWYPLTFMRYSFFLVLYPLGVTGEWFIVLSQARLDNWELTLVNILLYVVLASYIPFFPQLFGHMLKQRKQKL